MCDRKNQPLTLTIKTSFYSLIAGDNFIAFFSFENSKFKIKPLLFLNIDDSDRSIFSILVLFMESKMKLQYEILELTSLRTVSDL